MPGFEDLWFNVLQRMAQEHEDFQHAALRKAGWNYHSSTPGSHWMWHKEIDGKTYMVNTFTAARIQEYADRRAYFEKYPDELGD